MLSQDINPQTELENHTFEITATSSQDQLVNSLTVVSRILKSCNSNADPDLWHQRASVHQQHQSSYQADLQAD